MFMSKSSFVTLVAVAMACVAHQCKAQGTVSYVPLHLFISGPGGVSPPLDGQLLEVGQRYDLTAIPDSGAAFSSWQPVNVFTFTSYIVDAGGGVTTNISVVSSPVAQFIYTSSLSFTMQPQTLIFDNPGVQTITEGSGWQANFEPVPEPSTLTLIVCGITATMSHRCRRLYRE